MPIAGNLHQGALRSACGDGNASIFVVVDCILRNNPPFRSYVQLDIEPSFKHQRVVDCILQILFRPQVPFRRQDRLMPQQKLNLFQFPALRSA